MVVDALDLVKCFFTSTYLTLPNDDFMKRVVDETEDENILRYARDILFAMTKERESSI